MTLPEGIRREVETRLGSVRTASAVGGGCVNHALRLELEGGAVFLKHNPEAPAGMFAVEAQGLRHLREAAGGELRIPRVLAVQDAGQGGKGGWLALEWLEPARRAEDYPERLGRGLAALHRAGGGGWGWESDGYIGPLPQPNAETDTWAEFWAQRRLEPQLRLAREAGRQPGRAAEWKRLFGALPALLETADEDGPSLLHGDLWGGNVLAAKPNALAAKPNVLAAKPNVPAADGEAVPALIDPAAYRGHREVDLAMSELFGGFDPAFHAAYRESWPLRPGYEEVRRGVYQLYYLLVHVNLFGAGYGEQTARVLRGVLAAC